MRLRLPSRTIRNKLQCEIISDPAAVEHAGSDGTQRDEAIHIPIDRWPIDRWIPIGRNLPLIVSNLVIYLSCQRGRLPAHSDEGMQFGGINMWRGATRRKPFLSGASVTRVGTVGRGKMTIYPIRQFDDGTQLVNWVVEQQRDEFGPNDWAMPGRIRDFIGPYADWHFDWLDIPEMIGNAEYIYEHPMLDRNPIDRWTFGRVTLLGDAAHPMYPRGGNGGAQAILDAETLAAMLRRFDESGRRRFRSYSASNSLPLVSRPSRSAWALAASSSA